MLVVLCSCVSDYDDGGGGGGSLSALCCHVLALAAVNIPTTSSFRNHIQQVSESWASLVHPFPHTEAGPALPYMEATSSSSSKQMPIKREYKECTDSLLIKEMEVGAVRKKVKVVQDQGTHHSEQLKDMTKTIANENDNIKETIFSPTNVSKFKELEEYTLKPLSKQKHKKVPLYAQDEPEDKEMLFRWRKAINDEKRRSEAKTASNLLRDIDQRDQSTRELMDHKERELEESLRRIKVDHSNKKQVSEKKGKKKRLKIGTSTPHPSMTIGVRKPVRVWSKDRVKRHGIVAESLAQLKEKAGNIFELPKDAVTRIVLEEDGTLVNDDDFDILEPETRLILLFGNEVWEPTYVPLDIDSVKKAGNFNEEERAVELFKSISQNNLVVHSFSLVDLEIITDANLDKLKLKSLTKETAEKMQEICEVIYDKKKIEADRIEFETFLKENQFSPDVKFPKD